MKKDGFTLVELIGIIGLMAVLMVLLIPTISSSSTKSKNKIYETKMDLIESAAIMFGQDNYRSIVNESHKDSSGNLLKTIKVKDLIPDYYTADNDSSTDMVNDPRETGKFLDEYEIQIKIDPNTRKVTAKIQNR